MKTYDLAMIEPGNPVPIVAENVEYESLDAALAAWPGFHEATDDEYAAYVDYWNARHDWPCPTLIEVNKARAEGSTT